MMGVDDLSLTMQTTYKSNLNWIRTLSAIATI
jgi:hypothetical protein